MMDLFLYVLVTLSLGAWTVCGQDPKVSIVETVPSSNEKGLIKAKQDEDVTLDCYVENLPQGHLVRWRRKYNDATGKEQLQDISSDEGAIDNTKHGIEKPSPFKWRLRVKKIIVPDEGLYECYITLVIQTVAIASRTIVVMIPPTFDPAETSTDMSVKEGENAMLKCRATGRPEPTIVWTRQGGAMLPVGMEVYRGEKLDIPNVRYQFRGIYFCDVYNEMGKDRRQINLQVRFKPQIEILDRVVYQAVGYQVELQCFVDSNPYPKDGAISWQKGTITYSRSSGGYEVKAVRGAFNRMTYELIIKEVQESDFGKYLCNVKNSEGQSFKEIELRRSDTPVKSKKLGRVVQPGGSSAVRSSIFLLAGVLAIVLLL